MKLQDLLRHVADNAENGRPYGHGLRYSAEYHGTGEIYEQGLLNFLAPHWYELKPKTRMLNGFEVPAPEDDSIGLGQIYYCPSVTGYDKFIDCVWSNDESDFIALARGIVFLTERDAVAAANAMLGIGPRTQEKQ